MTFEPIELLKKRVSLAKEDSDTVYFDELLLYGEFLTKLISIQLVSAILPEKDRIQYKYEYKLIRGNAIGQFSEVIDEVLINHGDKLVRDYVLNEAKELTQKTLEGQWQFEAVNLLNILARNLKIELKRLPTKVSLRRWFSDFTFLRNKSKGHGALKPSLRAQNVLLLEKSINLIIDNFYGISSRSWVYLYQNLSGKYRISPISNAVSPFLHLKQNSDFRNTYTNGCYCYLDSPVKVNLLISTPEIDDFFVPNGNCRSGAYEIISYVSGSTEKIKNESYSLPITELPKSHTEGIGNLEAQGETFGNIPPKPRIYINRNTLEKELYTQMQNTYMSPIITLLGKGGIGKTTIALNCLHQIAKVELFSVIMWFSSRDIDLLIDGPKAVKTKIFTVQDIADEYCRLLDLNLKNKKERLEKFQIGLSTESNIGKTLFVFDNFETIDDPLEVYNWLYQFIRPPNKILITSRESRDFKGDYPIEIGKMNHEECKELIDIYSSELSISNLLTVKYTEKLIEESDGHPYIIKILLGEVARNKELKSIERIVAGRGDILTALFRRTFSTLSHAAVRVFLTLCSWRSAIPQTALEAVLLRPQNEERIDVDDAIEELRKCSFIDIFKSELDNSNFISTPLAASIFGKEELDIYTEKLAILEDRKLLLQFGVTQERDVKNGLIPKIERKFRAISKYIDSNPKKGIEYLKDNLPVLEYLCTKIPIAYLYLSDLFEELGDIEKVVDATKRFIQSNPSSTEKRKAWRKLVNIYMNRNDWVAESHALSEICLIPDTPISDVSNIADRIIKKIKSQNETDIEHKNLIFSKVAEIFEKRISESKVSSDYSRLSWLYIHLKNRDKSLSLARKGTKLNPHCVFCNKIINTFEEVG